ncbi:hypothetical protein [Amaricoccus sp.]|uniref:hypothetical protein n=1 Tax=Amaricoccus sp. TaxID=1872485 RepID=UPI001B4A9D29|nr:hypothetical protein [Amaricoccus sp.]MBP7242279.1 hypothetical protein [Amaricoccus sp.]
MRKAIPIAVAALAMAGAAFAASPGVDQTCLNRFRAYDRATTTFSNSDWGRDGVIAPATSNAIQRLRAGGCITDWDDIALMPTVAGELHGKLKGEHGPAIRPTSLMVGIVTGYSGELQARQFFSAMGYRVRSQGAPYLGRRIFIGPFATEGGLAEATGVALRAGFVAPYPKFF